MAQGQRRESGESSHGGIPQPVVGDLPPEIVVERCGLLDILEASHLQNLPIGLSRGGIVRYLQRTDMMTRLIGITDKAGVDQIHLFGTGDEVGLTPTEVLA